MDLSPLLTGQVDLTKWALIIGAGLFLMSRFAPGLLPLAKSVLGNLTVPAAPKTVDRNADTLEAGIDLCRALMREGKHEQAAQVMRDVLPQLMACESKEA